MSAWNEGRRNSRHRKTGRQSLTQEYIAVTIRGDEIVEDIPGGGSATPGVEQLAQTVDQVVHPALRRRHRVAATRQGSGLIDHRGRGCDLPRIRLLILTEGQGGFDST